MVEAVVGRCRPAGVLATVLTDGVLLYPKAFASLLVSRLSLEKMPLELWNRRGVAASVAGFANLFRLEHACLHGSEFSSIFVLVKVEALHHIPHHLAFHRVDGNGTYADVIINEIWDVARSLGAPTAPPRRGEEGMGEPSPAQTKSYSGVDLRGGRISRIQQLSKLFTPRANSSATPTKRQSGSISLATRSIEPLAAA
ncbi:hypothetical protein VPH35_139880 [Triticum aestivum]